VGAPAVEAMSDWRAVELFQARSGAEYSAFAVGLAIAACGNRKDGGWTHVSPSRIALLARVDTKSVYRAISDLVAGGELEYIPGTNRHNPSRYRIRADVLAEGADRFRCPLTIDKLSTVNSDDRGSHHGQFDAHLGQIDHGAIDKLSTPSVKNRSLDQMSDQSARERARTDGASRDAGVEQKPFYDAVALKDELNACRRSVDSAREDESVPNPTPRSPLAQEYSDDDYWRRRASAEPSLSPGLPGSWIEEDDRQRAETIAKASRYRAEHPPTRPGRS